MHTLVFALALAGIVLTALVAAATLRLRSPLSFLLAAYLLASAEIVALTLVLSPLRLVGASAYAIGEAALLAAVLALWQRQGRPRPSLPSIDLRAAARRHPVLAGLAAAVAIALCYELFIVLATPPNNGDSLTYHLTRAAAWLDHGGLYRIPGPEKTPENDYPPNAEIEILFSFAFLHGDGAAALTQFLAQAAAMLAIFGCAKRLGFSRPASLFAALLAPTLSEIALQSVTTQNDLVAASFVGAAAYFVHGRERPDLALAGLAVGLALGTKFTVLFALPCLVLIALAALRGRARLVALATPIAGFAAVGSYAYVRNLVHSGQVFGSLAGDPGLQRPEITATGTVSTLARYVHHMIDFSGYPLGISDLRPIATVARAAFLALHIPQNPPESTGYAFGFALNVRANEDLAFFGPLGVLLVVPLSVAFLVLAASRRAAPAQAAHAAALPLYLIALALGYRYGGQGRFLITPVVLTLPLAASLYRWRTLAAGAALIGAVSLFFAQTYNELKPTGLRGTTPIWRLTRSAAQGVQWPASLGYALDRLEAVVPPDARLGVVVGEHDADYALYGPRLTRGVVPLPAGDVLGAARRSGLRWVYLGRFAPVPSRAPGWTVERLSDSGTLLSRSP